MVGAESLDSPSSNSQSYYLNAHWHALIRSPHPIDTVCHYSSELY